MVIINDLTSGRSPLNFIFFHSGPECLKNFLSVFFKNSFKRLPRMSKKDIICLKSFLYPIKYHYG